MQVRVLSCRNARLQGRPMQSSEFRVYSSLTRQTDQYSPTSHSWGATANAAIRTYECTCIHQHHTQTPPKITAHASPSPPLRASLDPREVSPPGHFRLGRAGCSGTNGGITARGGQKANSRPPATRACKPARSSYPCPRAASCPCSCLAPQTALPKPPPSAPCGALLPPHIHRFTGTHPTSS